jgi:hypothetical protein
MKNIGPFSVGRSFLFISAMLLVLIIASASAAAELRIPPVSGNQGEEIKLYVTVDKVDNLAGIKLTLLYDKDVLKFIRGERTQYTSNMLHVINDKVPGRLIIVMAAAKGFTGENAPLVEMAFELLKDVKKEDNVTLKVIEASLMSDNLKKIKIKPQ